MLNSLTAEIAVVDRNGIIRAVNKGWQCFARDNSDSLGKPVASVGVGANYLSVCDADSRSGIEAVLSGLLPEFSLEYPCDSPTQKRWFLMTVVPLGRGGHHPRRHKRHQTCHTGRTASKPYP
ncbi:PAS domain-containing protein [bacterium]|nr:PAS domain-containing protein [bacterium]